MQHALILALNSGQREADLLRLPWSAYDGTWIRLRQGKSRRGQKQPRLIEIPCTSELRQMLDGIERRAVTILATKTDRAYKKRYFIKCWGDVMTEAGLDSVQFPNMEAPVKLHFHDLRGTCVLKLAEAGATIQEIAAITGHLFKTAHQILERYLPRTASMAQQAIAKLENSDRTKNVNRAVNWIPERTKANRKKQEVQ